MVIIGLAIIILVMVLAFFYGQFVVPAGELGNYSSSLNITIPNIL